jgi:hypothetical protein
MTKIVLLTFFLTYSLLARENPFSPQKLIQSQQIITPMINMEKKPILVKEKKEEIKKIIQPAKTVTIKPPKPTVVEKKPSHTKIVQKPKKRKIHKKITRSKLIYRGEFAKIKLKGSNIKIITHDNLLKHFILKSPNRVVIDLERFDVVKSFYKKIFKSKISSIKIGHHDYFYRITLYLKKDYRYKIQKKSFGYMIKLY